MKALSAALAAALVAAAIPAAAQSFDLSTIKCKEFAAKPDGDATVIMMWLDGYYSEDEAPAILDMTQIKARMKKLGDYCSSNPEAGLVTAFETAGKKE